MTEAPLRIGLVGFDGVQTLDLTGPLDAFGAANQARPGAYEVTILSLDGPPFTSEAGMRISPAGALVGAPVLDTLIIAGGEGFDLEVHVPDSKRFKSGWGFFVNSGDKPAKVLPTNACCYACRTEHGAVQTTLVQFYPTAKPIAVKAGTFDKSK